MASDICRRRRLTAWLMTLGSTDGRTRRPLPAHLQRESRILYALPTQRYTTQSIVGVTVLVWQKQ
jgi:hypothetical protein